MFLKKKLNMNLLWWGAQSTKDYEYTKRIILCNQFSLLFFSISAIYLLLFWVLNTQELSVLMVPFLILFGSGPILNKLGFINVSKVILIGTLLTGIYCYAAILGKESGIQNVLFPMIVIIPTLFERDKKLTKLTFILLTFFAYFSLEFTHFSFFYKIHLQDALLKTLYFSVSVTVFIILYKIVQFQAQLLHQAKATLTLFLKRYNLTQREGDIVDKLCDGLNNKDIADKLFIEETTVKTHLRQIFRKLHVKSRIEILSLFLKKPE